MTPLWRGAAAGGAAAGAATAALLGQAWTVRRRVPRLPDAMGSRDGLVGAGPAFRLEVIGESSVSGVGIEQFDDSLVPALARRLAQRGGRRVAWRAHGWSGARVHGVCERLLPRVAGDVDLLVVILGVNDVLRLTPPCDWEAGVARLLSCVQQRLGPTPVAWVGLPQLGHFRGLPQPLRTLAGTRVAAFERRTAQALRRTSTGWVIPTPRHELAAFGADGFHPDAAGYRTWGEHIADAACQHLGLGRTVKPSQQILVLTPSRSGRAVPRRPSAARAFTTSFLKLNGAAGVPDEVSALRVLDAAAWMRGTKGPLL